MAFFLSELSPRLGKHPPCRATAKACSGAEGLLCTMATVSTAVQPPTRPPKGSEGSALWAPHPGPLSASLWESKTPGHSKIPLSQRCFQQEDRSVEAHGSIVRGAGPSLAAHPLLPALPQDSEVPVSPPRKGPLPSASARPQTGQVVRMGFLSPPHPLTPLLVFLLFIEA